MSKKFNFRIRFFLKRTDSPFSTKNYNRFIIDIGEVNKVLPSRILKNRAAWIRVLWDWFKNWLNEPPSGLSATLETKKKRIKPAETSTLRQTHLRSSSIALRFCLSCQVGDGSTDVAAWIRPRRDVCKGDIGWRRSFNGSEGGATNGISSKPLGNGGKTSPPKMGTGNWEARWKNQIVAWMWMDQREFYILNRWHQRWWRASTRSW